MSQRFVAISKDELASLEVARFSGEIKIIENEADIPDAVNELRKEKMVGFDTETKPSFRKGQYHNVALIQFATSEKAFPFRINKTGFSRHLIDFFEDNEILKIGLSTRDDFLNLNRQCKFEPQNFIEIQNYVKDFLITDNSLSKIYAILFGKRISKGQRLTNWEDDCLSEAQQDYAALDASACLEIYNYLREGKFNPMSSLYYKEISEEESSLS